MPNWNFPGPWGWCTKTKLGLTNGSVSSLSKHNRAHKALYLGARHTCPKHASWACIGQVRCVAALKGMVVGLWLPKKDKCKKKVEPGQVSTSLTHFSQLVFTRLCTRVVHVRARHLTLDSIFRPYNLPFQFWFLVGATPHALDRSNASNRAQNA